MTNKPRGMLYIGVTANLVARIEQQREWKIKLIEGSNPDWRDLADLVL